MRYPLLMLAFLIPTFTDAQRSNHRSGDLVIISDLAFEKVLVEKGMDDEVDGYISRSRLGRVDTLDISRPTYEGKGEIQDVSVLKYFRKLRYLDCANNQIQYLNTSSNRKLRYLHSSHNAVNIEIVTHKNKKLNTLIIGYGIMGVRFAPHFDLSCNKRLKELYIWQVEMDSFDVGNLKKLELLQVHSSPVRYIDISQCKNLKNVSFNSNPNLSEMDFSGNKNIKILALTFGSFTRVDLSPLKNLTWFACYGNSISEMKLPTNPKLKFLECGQNKFSTLDLKSCKDLKFIACYNNPLQTLQLHKKLPEPMIDPEFGDETKLSDQIQSFTNVEYERLQ